MGYAFYFGSAIESDGVQRSRPLGYGVLATCDKRGCHTEIDRGLGYLCGDTPHDLFSDERGCGRYYCGEHSAFVGPRGGCPHRGTRAWGRTLSCMHITVRRWHLPHDRPGEETGEEEVYCLFRAGHEGPHAPEVEDPAA